MHFTVEKSDRHNLNQVIKIKMLSILIGQIDSTCLLIWCSEITSEIFLPKIHSLNLIVKKHQANTIERDILQSNGPVIFKSVKARKVKENLKNRSRLEETEDTCQLNEKHYSELDPGPIKNMIGTIVKFGMRPVD